MSHNILKVAARGSADVVYIEDVFSTYLYTGNGSTQTITNGIDLAGKGGLVWTKDRSSGTNTHKLVDTVRGYQYAIQTSDTNGQEDNLTTGISSFSSIGYSIGIDYRWNKLNDTYVSWTFRKQPKFFDIVTYTGNGVPGRMINHNLGVRPGLTIIKCTSASTDWWVAARKNDTTYGALNLNLIAAGSTQAFGSDFTSTQFNPSAISGSTTETNASGETYVAYLFAHNAGGFGASGNDNVISCGSFTTDSNGKATVSLEYEPQWVLLKRTDGDGGGTGNWSLTDSMRGWVANGNVNARLQPNTADAEDTSNSEAGKLFATGFSPSWNANATYIYIAIRRGPMKVPTDGTKVYAGITYSGNSAARSLTGAGFPPDLSIISSRNKSLSKGAIDRLRGVTPFLQTESTAAENTNDQQLGSFDMDGVSYVANSANFTNGNTYTYINWLFRRAPGFFDEVCYAGTGSTATVTHNLGVAPEFIIAKKRNGGSLSGVGNWMVGSLFGASTFMQDQLQSTNSAGSVSYGSSQSFSAQPTASSFSVADGANKYVSLSESGTTYVAYLFASCPGVSKVGSYTGNGTSQTINCGFTAGARFVLIKRTDSTGDWCVWDSARGIVSGDDPYLTLNTTAAEVTNKDAVDADNSGFVVNETTGPNINTNTATYIYLAIA